MVMGFWSRIVNPFHKKNPILGTLLKDPPLKATLGLFDKPVLPAPTDPGNVRAKEAARVAAEWEKRRLKKRKGRRSTILTSPEGITTEPTVYKTTLG
jgi:hypothetical protein